MLLVNAKFYTRVSAPSTAQLANCYTYSFFDQSTMLHSHNLPERAHSLTVLRNVPPLCKIRRPKLISKSGNIPPQCGEFNDHVLEKSGEEAG